MMQKKKANANEATGQIEEILPNALFRVAVDKTDNQVLAYLSGKMRMNRIRVLVGDRVSLVLDEQKENARITKRL